MIETFASKSAERFFNRQDVRQFRAFAEQADIKLRMLNAAATLDDLRTPPGNRLEALKGNRKGQHSIRINRQFRICFRWKEGKGAFDVEIVDYH